MSKSLILDWQKNSLMLARAHGRSSKAAIEAVVIKPVGNTETVSQTASEALRAAAQDLHAKGEVCVLVARELVEMRTVQIPKMDPDELPDVIRFQAQRQFANMSDAWTVDYVMLPTAVGSEMQTALVAAISPAQLNEIESACTSAGLQATTIGLRPLQIVQLAVESGLVSGSGRSMIVCVSESVADILILRDGKVLQVRSTKLPHEAEHAGPALQGEVRRSLVAAASELESKPIDSVLLIASAGRSEKLLVSLQQASGVKAVAFHPETLLTHGDASLADTAGSRLAAVAGAMGLQSADRATVVNFKNPKRRPPKKRDSRKWLLVGGAAAALIVAAVGWYYSTINSLDSEYALINEEINALKESGESAKRRLAEYAAIEKFASESPNWLDELVYISKNAPSSDKIMLTSPSFSIGRNGVGLIDLTVRATDSESISNFAGSLSNENYLVRPFPTSQLPRPEGRYKFQGVGKVEVTGKGWDLSASNQKSESANASTQRPASAAEKSSSEQPSSEQSNPADSPKVEKPLENKPNAQSEAAKPAVDTADVTTDKTEDSKPVTQEAGESKPSVSKPSDTNVEKESPPVQPGK